MALGDAVFYMKALLTAIAGHHSDRGKLLTDAVWAQYSQAYCGQTIVIGFVHHLLYLLMR